MAGVSCGHKELLALALSNLLYSAPMSIWMRISDIAQTVGDSLLAVLQALTGNRGERPPEDSVAFTIAMVALSAKMAKADGEVTNDEVAAFREIFSVQPDEYANVTRIFNLAKQDVAGYEAYALQVAKMFEDRPEILENVMDGLFHIAKADGEVPQSELDYLHSVAEHFGLRDRFRCIRARHVHMAADDPYVVLGVDPCISDRELKRLYRDIVKENHPDHHIAAGMPEEMIVVATERLAAINAAWDQISQERGF